MICEGFRGIILRVWIHTLLFLRWGSVQDGLTDPESGRKFASVTRIPGRGHLVFDLPFGSFTR